MAASVRGSPCSNSLLERIFRPKPIPQHYATVITFFDEARLWEVSYALLSNSLDFKEIAEVWTLGQFR